jgi:hypothetical protein
MDIGRAAAAPFFEAADATVDSNSGNFCGQAAPDLVGLAKSPQQLEIE